MSNAGFGNAVYDSEEDYEVLVASANPQPTNPQSNTVSNYGCNDYPYVCNIPSPAQPDPDIAFAMNILGSFAEAVDDVALGGVAAAISLWNDPSLSNAVMTGGSFIPYVGWGFGVTGLVYSGAQWITNHVMLPMFNAIPGDNTGNGNGQLVPSPDATDSSWCAAVGGC